MGGLTWSENSSIALAGWTGGTEDCKDQQEVSCKQAYLQGSFVLVLFCFSFLFLCFCLSRQGFCVSRL